MDRQIIYVGAIPQDVDQLLQNKNTMIGFGWLTQALLGTSTLVSGLACTPTGPASMQVLVAPGEIFAQENVDGTAYGSLNADTTHQIVKQGLVIGTTTFSCPAPSTSGYSVVYLVEAAYEDSDTGSTVLPYYNASNPSQAYNGPNNTGVSQNTVRQGVCLLQLKTGVAATTGTQVTPTADAGFTSLYAITVANGQTTITSGSIATVSGAPFITETLTQKISEATGDARYLLASSKASWEATDTGTANNYAATLSPAPSSYFVGMRVTLLIANTNTNTSSPPVVNFNSLGNKNILDLSSTGILVNPAPGRLPANIFAELEFDGTQFQIISRRPARSVLNGNLSLYVATTGSDSTGNGLSSGTAWATIQHAINYAANNIDLAGFNVTINVADGTYTGNVIVVGPWVGTGTVTLSGDTATPANCIISTTSADCIDVTNGGFLSVQGFKLATTTSGSCLNASSGTISIIGSMNFGAAATAHMIAGANGAIFPQSNYTISGGAAEHCYANNGGIISFTGAQTITLSGTPAFTTFANIQNLSLLEIGGNTFSGSATGVRYNVSANGVIQTNSGGATYLPGNSSGTTGSGGQYI